MGAESCTDSDLLAILIGSGGRGFSAENVARELMNRFGTLSGMMGVPLKELAKVRGVGPVKAIRLAAAYELTCRIVKYLEHNG